jgi:cell division GTPase FtsZ
VKLECCRYCDLDILDQCPYKWNNELDLCDEARREMEENAEKEAIKRATREQLEAIAEAVDEAGPKVTALVAILGDEEDTIGWGKVQEAFKAIMVPAEDCL